MPSDLGQRRILTTMATVNAVSRKRRHGSACYGVRLRIPELFDERGWTAYEVAKRSRGRLAERSLYRLVERRGQVESVSAKTVDTLCEVLGVGPGELIEVQKRPARPRA